jgi:hypothetical protein
MTNTNTIPTRRERIAQVTNEATPAYVKTMLFANTMSTGPDGETVFDDVRDTAHASQRARKAARAAVRDFVRSLYSADIETPIAAERDEFIACHGSAALGSCFALSRNGHGAGFFDRGIGFPALQAHARTWGEDTWRVASKGGRVDPF